MLFSSAIFLFLFLPLFLIGYHALAFWLPTAFKQRMNWLNAFLLAASLLFYAWGEGPVVLILLLSVSINFGAGLLIERGHRKLGLYISLIGSLLLLVYFKYSNFLAGLVGVSMAPISLPIGISFYTFQGISYNLDVYWGRIKANRNFLNFGAYVAMFPHQIAGPIVRYADIAPELNNRTVTLEHFGTGAERFIIGLAKKILIANTFASLADTVFNAPTVSITPGAAWLGAVAYSFQIYFDFSGYSDMAIGLGKMIGFDFKENFNYPYIARSIQDFWRRWHISLSSWFRDYLYIPLGGNRLGEAKTYRNLLIVFTVTGLWHGASWNFIIWGLYHGLFLMLERAGLGKRLEKTPALFTHAYTLLVVLVGWVFFRAADLPSALLFLQKMIGLGPSSTLVAYSLPYFITPENVFTLLLGIVFLGPVYHQLHKSLNIQKGLPSVAYSLGLFGLFILSVMYLAANTYNPFIYFRF
jgi:alginate O-acetyltransferase complex protein AlgI